MIQRRLASEEEILSLADITAEVNSRLDLKFNEIYEQIEEMEDALMQPLPLLPDAFFSSKCLLLHFPHAIDYSRVEISHSQFEVLSIFSSDEAHCLIYPLNMSDEFMHASILNITYHLDIGNDLPRYRYNSQVDEDLSILL